MAAVSVDRCICHELPFSHLLKVARDGNLSFEELSLQTGCSTGCGMCGPYVRLVLHTGRTRLPVLSESQIASLLASPPPAADRA